MKFVFLVLWEIWSQNIEIEILCTRNAGRNFLDSLDMNELKTTQNICLVLYAYLGFSTSYYIPQNSMEIKFLEHSCWFETFFYYNFVCKIFVWI